MLFLKGVFGRKHFESQSLSKIVFIVVNGLPEGIKLVCFFFCSRYFLFLFKNTSTSSNAFTLNRFSQVPLQKRLAWSRFLTSFCLLTTEGL